MICYNDIIIHSCIVRIQKPVIRHCMKGFVLVYIITDNARHATFFDEQKIIAVMKFTINPKSQEWI